jgi:hypothetical protein
MMEGNDKQLAIWLAGINISYGLSQAAGAAMGSRLIGSRHEYSKMIALTAVSTLSSALTAVSVSSPMLLLSRSLSGLSDQYTPIANSWVARKYDGDRMTTALARQSTARFAGFISGAALAGLWPGNSLQQGIAVLTAAMLIPMILLYQAKKEIQDANDSRFKGKACSDTVVTDDTLVSRRQPVPKIWLLVYGLVLATQLTNVSAWPAYSMFKFNWHGRQVGLAIVVFAALAIFSQLFVMPVLLRLLSAQKVIQLGFISVCLASIGYIFAQNVQELFLIAALNFAGYCLEPLVKSLAIKRTTGMLRVKLISRVSSVSAFAFIGAGFWSNLLLIPYTSFPDHTVYLGLPFATSALLSITALTLVTVYGCRLGRDA